MGTKVGAVWVARVLMAALFLFAGVSKLRALPEEAAFSHVFVLGVATIGPALIALAVCSWVAFELRGMLLWARRPRPS